LLKITITINVLVGRSAAKARRKAPFSARALLDNVSLQLARFIDEYTNAGSAEEAIEPLLQARNSLGNTTIKVPFAANRNHDKRCLGLRECCQHIGFITRNVAIHRDKRCFWRKEDTPREMLLCLGGAANAVRLV